MHFWAGQEDQMRNRNSISCKQVVKSCCCLSVYGMRQLETQELHNCVVRDLSVRFQKDKLHYLSHDLLITTVITYYYFITTYNN